MYKWKMNMNTNWRNRPTTIDEIPNDIDFVISIDESGSASLRQVLKAKRNGTEVADSEKHFTVTACLIAMSDFIQAQDMIMGLKYKYWDNALFEYDGITKRVCFHSRDIRNRRGAFNPDLIDYDAFILDLSHVIDEMPMTLYASHIDKAKHANHYKYPSSPYDLCMTFVLERIMRDVPEDAKCVVILEARGEKEDKELFNNIKNLLDHGNSYYDSSVFSKIAGVYFNPKWCKKENDQASYWQLELADLCAYPIQKYFVYGKRDKAFEVLLPKISCYPNYIGRGLKSFP